MLTLHTIIWKFLLVIKTSHCKLFSIYMHFLSKINMKTVLILIPIHLDHCYSKSECNICLELTYLIHYKYIGSRFNDISNIRGYIYNSIYLSFIFFKRYYAHKTNFTRLTLPLVYIRSAKTSKCEEHKAHHIEHVF